MDICNILTVEPEDVKITEAGIEDDMDDVQFVSTTTTSTTITSTKSEVKEEKQDEEDDDVGFVAVAH
jgi:hypothetical protein